MPIIKTKIELNEKDLIELIAEKYNLDIAKTSINVYKYDGEGREPGYTTVIVEGVAKYISKIDR